MRQNSSHVVALLGGVVVTLAHAGLLRTHFHYMWAKPHYQFFPFVFLGAVVLASAGLRKPGPMGTPAPLWGSLILLPTLAFFGVAVLIYSPWVASVSFLTSLAGATVAFGGWVLFKRVLPAWLFLWLIVPLPMRIDERFIIWLQGLAAQWSSHVLDFFGFVHVLAGNVIEVPQTRLLVEEACSGIHSLFAVLTCLWFFILWSRPGVVRAIFWIFAGVGWVLIVNAARVTTVGVFATKWEINISEGLTHDILGWVMYVVILGLIWSSDRVWLFATAPRWIWKRNRKKSNPLPDQREGSPDLRGAVANMRGKGLVVPCILTAGFLAFGAAQWLVLRPDVGREPVQARDLGPGSLPARWGSWSFDSFEVKEKEVHNHFCDISQLWHYRSGERNAVLSIDYPFMGWHELTICYYTQGWTLEDRTAASGEANSGESPYIVSQLRKLDQYGYLIYGMLDESGRPLAAPSGVWDAVVHRLKGSYLPIVNTPNYQLQLFVTSYAPLNEDELAELSSFFTNVQGTLLGQSANGESEAE